MNKKGMTLAELLVATAVGAVVFALLLMIYHQSLKSSSAIETEADIQQFARKALDQMVSELKRGQLVSGGPINAVTLKVWLPVFQAAGGGCSAYDISSGSQLPVSCANDASCAASCAAASSKCNLSSSGNLGTCLKQYEYQVISSDGISKLVSYELDGGGVPVGSPHVIANQIQNLAFSNTGLASNEVQVSLTAQEMSRYEKKTRTATVWTVVHLRN